MSRTRMSRGLVACVGVIIALGAVAYFHNSNKSKAKEIVVSPQGTTPTAGAPAQAAKPVVAAPPARSTGQIALPGSIKPMVTQTPGAEVAKTPVTEPKPTSTGTPAPVVVAKAVPTEHPVSKAPLVSTGNALADGKAQIEAGHLLAGRVILNDALIAGQFSEADAQQAKDLIAQANETIIFSPRRFPEDPFQGSYTVQAGDRPMKIASRCEVTWEFLGRINGISDARRLRASQTLKTVKGPFHAVVSKSKFTLEIYFGSPGERGSMYVRSFPVGLGKHGSTPTGTWMLAPQGKLKNPKWWGTADEPAREAGDPLNPIGKYWMGLNGTEGDAVGKEGFGIHGTIDPDSMGKEMSHGCIRLVNENVEKVYEMLIDGKSTVIVRD
jgi:lipoprotein-anchoring transpeptidase ErfK/SrfK